MLMVKQITMLKTEMEILLVKYGRMKQEAFDAPFKYLDKLSYPQLKQLYNFLTDFYSNEFDKLHKIFQKPLDNSPNGPELWDGYFAKGKHYLIEMRLLRDQATVCRKRWSENPILELKFEKENTDEKNTDSIDDTNQTDSKGIGV